jgi:hypothetical protein
VFRHLIRQRFLLAFRRYGNYLNLFFLLLFGLLTYYASPPFLRDPSLPLQISIPQKVASLLLWISLALPLLTLPKILQLFFIDKESTFLLTYPLSLKQYYVLRVGELLASYSIWYYLGVALALRAYQLTSNLSLFLSLLTIFFLFLAFMLAFSLCLSFLYYRFLSFSRLLLFALLLLALSPTGIFKPAFVYSLPCSPFRYFFIALTQGETSSFLYLILEILALWILSAFLYSRYFLSLLSQAGEADRSRRSQLLKYYLHAGGSWLSPPVQALLFRDLAILIRRGFPRGTLAVLAIPTFVFFTLPYFPTRPNPLLNEMSVLFLQVLCFALGSFYPFY